MLSSVLPCFVIDGFCVVVCGVSLAMLLDISLVTVFLFDVLVVSWILTHQLI